MKSQGEFASVVTGLLVFAMLGTADCPAQIVRFEGARLYRDGTFVETTLMSRRGVIIADNSAAQEGESIETISFAGKFLLPAFGDVHTHRFTEDDAEAKDLYLSAGFLYVFNLNGTVMSRAQTAKHANNRTSPDVRFANAGFTCTGGHPVPLYTYLASRDPSVEKDKILQRISNYNFYITDSVEELNEKWPKFSRSGADIVKLFLLHSERWGNGSNEKSDGLRPEVAKAVAERARLAGLRTAAHVESAADASLALNCGVSLLAHMPGYGLKPDQNPAPYVVDDDLMRSAAQRGMAMSPTLGLVYADPKDTAGVEKVRAWKAEQVRRWKGAGVTLLYGSDSYFDMQSELRAMIDSNVWSPAELVEVVCVKTPRWIFPDRRIGALTQGFEAGFVALSSNPLDDSKALLKVEAVYKDGIRIWEPKAASEAKVERSPSK